MSCPSCTRADYTCTCEPEDPSHYRGEPSKVDLLRAENQLLHAVLDALPRCKVHPCRKPGTWMLCDLKVYCQQHAYKIVVEDWQCSLDREGTRQPWADAVDALETSRC